MSILDKIKNADIAKLLEKPTGTYEVKRLTKQMGEPFILTLQAISADDYADIQNSAMTIKHGKVADMDIHKMQIKTIVAGVSEPSFKDKDFMKLLNVRIPDDAVNKLFLPAEIAEIVQAISTLNGFSTQEEVNEEVKN